MLRYPRANPAKWWTRRSSRWTAHSPRTTSISPGRRWLTLTALLVLAALVCGAWYLTNPRRLSGMASLLLSHLLNHRVTVASGRLSLAGTLRLSGVRLGAARPGVPPLFYAREVDLRFDWLTLLSGHLRVQRLMALNPTIHLIENRATHAWNYQSIFRAAPAAAARSRPPGAPGIRAPSALAAFGAIRRLPVIKLHAMRICWGRIQHGIYEQTARSVLNARLTPRPHRHGLYRMWLEQRSAGGGVTMVLTGRWNLPQHRFTARITTLRLTRRLRRTLPWAVQKWWRRLDLQGGLRNVVVSLSPQAGIAVTGDLAGVSLQLPLAKATGSAQGMAVDGLSGHAALRGSRLWIRHLTGRILGYRFVIPAAHFDALGRSGPFGLTIQLPHWIIPATYPAVVRSSPAFQIARAILYRLRPSGLLDLTVRIRRTVEGAAPTVEGEILCRNLRARYVRFPYPLRRLQGVIRFTRHRIFFEHVAGLAETYPVSLDGEVSIHQDNGPIDLRISSDRAYFDQRLEACLPRAIQPIWKRLNPRGWGRFICQVRRPAGSTTDPQITLHIFPTDVRARYIDFPYPLRHVHGELYFTEHQTRVIRLTGWAGRHNVGRVILTGQVDYSSGHLRHLQPHLHVLATRIPLTRRLLDCLPSPYARWLGTLRPEGGNVGLDAEIAPPEKPHGDARGRGGLRQADEWGARLVGVVTLSDGVLRTPALPWPLRQVRVKAQVQGPRRWTLQASGQTGANGQGAFTATASMAASARHGALLQAAARWRHIVVTPDPGPPGVLPAAWWKIWMQTRPTGPISGSGSITLALLRRSGGPGANVRVKQFQAVFQPRGLSIAPAFLPAPLTDIRGVMTIDSGGWNISTLVGQADGAQWKLHGHYRNAAKMIHLAGSASAQNIDPKWLAALPGPWKGSLGSPPPQGAWSLNVPILQRSTRRANSPWHFSGVLQMRNLHLAGALAAHVPAAQVALAGDWAAGHAIPQAQGRFTISRLTLASQSIENLTGDFSCDAATHTILVPALAGRIAGGKLVGSVALHANKRANYQAEFKLTGAQLAGLLAGRNTRPTVAVTATQPGSGRGLISANLTLHGRLDQPQSRTGHGELVVRHANMYNLPLAMWLLQIATLRLPVSRAFQHAQIDYRVRYNTVRFTTIRLQSRGINVVGQGTLNLATQRLSLRMLTASPTGSQVPLLGLLFGLARSQLLQLYVGGTLQRPVIHAIPLELWIWPFE